MKYGILHYNGDVTQHVRPGQLLGHDEMFRPYEVIDAEYHAREDWTVVQLQTASAEALQAHQAGRE